MPKKTFYNLPAPWNPGYAMPQNALDEGLGHGALVTAQAPQGTYYTSQGAAFRSGYAIPKYVRDEGEGQGAMITKMLPRGTFVGADRGRSLRALGDVTGGRNPITEYGRQAAAYLLARVRYVPAPQRKAALKLVLDKVDPTLWQRTELAAVRYMSQGPARALELGLAEAMSRGMLQEIIATGRGRRPRPKSLLGLGCFGCAAALGSVLEELGEVTQRTGTSSGRTRDESGGTGRLTPPKPGEGADMVEIGPFRFGVGGSETRPQIVVHTASMPPVWKNYFAAEAKRLTARADVAAEAGAAAASVGRGMSGGASIKVVPAGQFGLEKWIGLRADTPVLPQLFNGGLPIVKSKDPGTGQDMGLYMIATPSSFGVWYRPVPPAKRSRWSRAWGALKNLAGKLLRGLAAAGQKVGEFAKDGLDKLGDLACKLVNTPGVELAASAGAAASGVPPEAGATGVGIAQGMCTPDAEAVVPVAPPPASSGIPLVPLALAAGGVAAIFLLTK